MPPSRSGRGGGAAAAALLASGALGFHLGYRISDWQVPVETAQVLAGVVVYPHETPFYVYHVNLWTILHQVCALFLRAGVSEIGLSRAMSGVLGMLSFQALAMVAFAFSRRVLVSTGIAALLFVSEVTNAGAVYPIYLMGVSFTYGVVGLSFAVLAAAAFGAGLRRVGAFLLGVAPALHPGLAAWLWVIVGVCALVDREARDALRASAPALLAGAGVAALSFAVHVMMSSGVPAGPVQTSRRYLDAFVTLWDGHRQPVELRERAVTINAAALVLATVWLRWWRRDVPEGAAFVLRFAQVAAVLALALVPLTWVSPGRLPVAVLALMPGRVLNFVALLFPAMLLGLLGSRPGGWRAAVMLLFAAALFVGDESALWRLVADGRPVWATIIKTHQVSYYGAAALLAGALAERRRARRADAGEPGRPRRAFELALRAATTAVVVAAVVVSSRTAERRRQVFIDRTNNLVLAAAAAAPGVLLTIGDAHLTQLRTRRPLLIDTGGLDAIAYMPATGPALHRILREVYGVDLFDPPPEARGSGRLPAEAHRQLWQRRTTEEWRELGRKYHATQVLTSPDWQLALPVVAGDRRYLLHAIPE